MNILILHGIGGYAGIHWQQWLHDQLIDQGFSVIMPTLSNSGHPDRNIWLKETINATNGIQPENIIVVGHSLGVTTALDYIEQLSSPLKGLVSVSGFTGDYGNELNSYYLHEKSINFKIVRRNIQKSVVIYGDNDPYVTQVALKKLASDLDDEPIVIPKGGHLNSETGFTQFPKLLEVINNF
jgi:predicted alpha/beta hydrolase family esterase